MSTLAEIPAIAQQASLCRDLLDTTEEVVGFRPEVAFQTYFVDNADTATYGYSANLPEAHASVQAILHSKGVKIVSDGNRQNNYAADHKRKKLSDYFTAENLAKVEVVQFEKVLIESVHYNIDKGYYFSFPIPPVSFDEPVGYFFLIAKDDAEAELVELNVKQLEAQYGRQYLEHMKKN